MAALAVLIAACDSSRSIAETAPQTSECTQCHGYPPPAFVMPGHTTDNTVHPTNASCNLCHPGTVEADNVTIVPGGLHMDGIVEVVGTGHAMPFVADHPAAAIANIASCQACHGADYGGGSAGVSCNACHADTTTYPALAPGFPDWKTNCTFCHGTRTANVTTATAPAAPPASVDRATAITDKGVGAHQAHLRQGTYANALPCATCHVVPTGAQSLTHFSGGAATIAFSALATQGVASPGYAGNGGSCAVYCHGSGNVILSPGTNRTPAWTSTGLACGACHATIPTSGEHAVHLNAGLGCSDCHGSGFTEGTAVNKALHVDGSVYKDPSLLWQEPPQYTTKSCDPSCHGRRNW